MEFKVSVQVHLTSWHRKDRLKEPKVISYMVMHPIFKRPETKYGRDEYEGVEVAVGQ